MAWRRVAYACLRAAVCLAMRARTALRRLRRAVGRRVAAGSGATLSFDARSGRPAGARRTWGAALAVRGVVLRACLELRSGAWARPAAACAELAEVVVDGPEVAEGAEMVLDTGRSLEVRRGPGPAGGGPPPAPPRMLSAVLVGADARDTDVTDLVNARARGEGLRVRHLAARAGMRDPATSALEVITSGLERARLPAEAPLP